MSRHDALTYVSGRLVALVVLLGFQVLLVRALPATEFAPYALIFSLATLMQTVVSFGVPRIISKYVGLGGWAVPNATIRALLIRMLLIRVIGTAVLLVLTAAVAWEVGALGPYGGGLLIFGGLYILVGVVQVDADSAAQALSLQRVSRNCAVGEAVLRFLIVLALALAGLLSTAGDVLAVSFATGAIASIVLLTADFRALSRSDRPEATQSLDRRELLSTGLNGYAGSLAWFASSPAIIRIIASYMLRITTFAGFAFVQGLVISFQRYTPGALLFPFVEPVVMRAYARTKDKHQLEAGLSIVSKVDAIVIGAAIIGAAVAARPVVELMTGGKYGETAYAIPWLLLYVLAMPVYRSFEIVALLLNTGATLTRTLLISLGWTAIAALAATRFGLIALLIGPVGDAVTRIGFLYHVLRRHGVTRAADLPVLSFMLGAVAVLGFGGDAFADFAAADPLQRFAVGMGCAFAYLAAMFVIRPFHPEEAALLGGGGSLVGTLRRRLTRHPSAVQNIEAG